MPFRFCSFDPNLLIVWFLKHPTKQALLKSERWTSCPAKHAYGLPSRISLTSSSTTSSTTQSRSWCRQFYGGVPVVPGAAGGGVAACSLTNRPTFQTHVVAFNSMVPNVWIKRCSGFNRSPCTLESSENICCHFRDN